MNKYEITTEKKKGDIVNAALALFTEKGFTRVSIKEIAECACVSQVSIYNYFGSKETLITRCVDILMADTRQRIEDVLLMDIPFVKKMELFFQDATKNIHLSFTRRFSEYALHDQALTGLLSKHVNELQKGFYRDIVEAGKRDGAIDRAMPTDMLVDCIEALSHVGRKWETEADAVTRIHAVYQILLYGILRK